MKFRDLLSITRRFLSGTSPVNHEKNRPDAARAVQQHQWGQQSLAHDANTAALRSEHQQAEGGRPRVFTFPTGWAQETERLSITDAGMDRIGSAPGFRSGSNITEAIVEISNIPRGIRLQEIGFLVSAMPWQSVFEQSQRMTWRQLVVAAGKNPEDLMPSKTEAVRSQNASLRPLPIPRPTSAFKQAQGIGL